MKDILLSTYLSRSSESEVINSSDGRPSAIQRIKTFHILDGEVKLSMKDIAEQIFTVCAYLMNLQSPIVNK
jgi:hypothetical protein